MLYLSLQSASNGSYQITVIFRLGTNLDTGQVLVLHRVDLALKVLSEEASPHRVPSEQAGSASS
jgi:multidrug efflux pump subunit AcrB